MAIPAVEAAAAAAAAISAAPGPPEATELAPLPAPPRFFRILPTLKTTSEPALAPPVELEASDEVPAPKKTENWLSPTFISIQDVWFGVIFISESYFMKYTTGRTFYIRKAVANVKPER